MPNGYAYAPSGLGYIPDISLPQALQPSIPTLPAGLQQPLSIPTLPAITPSGLGYIPDIELPPQLQPVTPSGLGYIPDVSLPQQLQPTVIEPAGYGPLELVGDVAKGAWDILSGVAGGIVEAGKSILENLEVGVGIAKGVATGISGITAQQKQAEAQRLQAEAQKIAAEAYKIQTLAAQLIGEPGIEPVTKQPLTYITPETGKAPNYVLYIGLAILAFLLLGKKIK